MEEVIEFLKRLEPLLESDPELRSKYDTIDIETLISDFASGEKEKYLKDIMDKD